MGRQLQLATARGTPIDNEQIEEISVFERAAFSDLETKYGRTFDIKIRCEATPRYNCHGMTFASRRTGIYDVAALLTIIAEDGYNAIKSSDVLPGDVLVYFDDRGDAEHSAIVLEPPSENNLNIPLVVSKWGKYRELIHRANNCPYTKANFKYFRVTP